MKNYTLLTILTYIFAVPFIYADTKCFYSIEDSAKNKVTWTAYKTPKKVGVDGSFSKITYFAQESDDLKTFLKSATVEIETASVDSGNKERDEKLAKFFFKLMKNPVIKAHVQNVQDNNTALIMLSMNKVKKEVSMKYTYENNLLTLTGEIDVLNWSLEKSLASINKACFALHEKKTWSDVALKITVPVKYECHEKL
jgi:polyisoprenoid-binding protein YceI